ncbi:MAG: FISUMP domain-containing protein [Bacteroidales bacterium]|nr:FISUMP domain-containing protein [Bacteroidales bacterium]
MKTTSTYSTIIALLILMIGASWSLDAQPRDEDNGEGHPNFRYIDDFEEGVDLWWTPEGSGSTAGIILTDDDDNLITYRAHETEIVNPHTGSTGSMKLAIQWDNEIEYEGVVSHLVRQHMPAGTANTPARQFGPGQALEVFIYGDGSGNRFRLMTRDGIPTLEGSQWMSIDWTGWRRITWNYNDPDNVVGWVNGNGVMDGEVFYFDSFQVTKDPEGAATSALLYFDDLRIVDPFSVVFNITGADGTEVITINGEQYEAGVTDFELFPGEYLFTVVKTGYQTYSGSFVVDDAGLTVEVTLYPAEDGQMPGDANCDGTVNVLDITTIVNYFVGNDPDPFCFENADVNGDGVINIMDVILTVDIFLGEGPGPGTVTDIDGNVYQTVIIGNQEWMAENLRVSKYNNGDAIPADLSNSEWHDTTEGAYAIYPHGMIDGLSSDAEVLEAYGALYNWYAVNTGNLCPQGWSVPSDAAWTQLVDYVVSQGFPNEWNNPGGAGNALKSCRQVGSPLEGCNTPEHPRWNSHSIHYGFDEFGFSALPGGLRSASGNFYDSGHLGHWWSSSEGPSATAWIRFILSDYG